MLQRPKPGETDEDVLKLQRLFLENKMKPSAKLVEDKDTEKISTDEDNTLTCIEERIENTFETIPNNANIGRIVERKNLYQSDTGFRLSKKGFPQAKRRDLNVTASKGSIFSQQIKRVKKEDIPVGTSNTFFMDTDASINFPKCSYVLSGKDKDEIHQENVRLLKSMKEEEILEERKKLLESMDPAIIAFLKDKRKKEYLSNTDRPTIGEQNKMNDFNIEEITVSREILSQSNAEKWLNFDVAETTKLAWMRDVKIDKIKKDSKYEARFDFQGWLLPYINNEINEQNRILYHHGEEPERPGYTLQELFQLCRSSVIQQKVTALNAIANILSLESSGIYEDVIELPIEQIFFVLRICVDDNTPSVLNASIKALRNLIYNHIDETCIDKLQGFGLGIVQPITAVNSKDNEDDETINDQQLAETDLIKCLSRSNILTRIRYIINTVRPSIETIVHCLEILLKLSRDSNYVMTQVYKSFDLIESIIKNFLPPLIGSDFKFGNRYPLIHCVKFVKVLCCRDVKIAKNMLSKYKIMHSIATYLSNDMLSLNAEGLKLQIESLHLWSCLLNYGLTAEYFAILQPILLRLLHYHASNTHVDASLILQAHASAVLNLLRESCKINYLYVQPFLEILFNFAIPKWVTQFCALREFTCGKLQIISVLLYLIVEIYEKHYTNCQALLGKMEEHIHKILYSQGFEVVTKCTINGSNLLSGFETYKSSANLICVETATWNSAEHIVPILQTHSSLPFLCQFAKLVKSCKDNSSKQKFLQHKYVQSYINSILECSTYTMTTNWFTRIETMLLMNILKISIQLQNVIDSQQFYALAIKCMGIFTIEQKADVEYLLENLIFRPTSYPTETLLQNLRIQNEEQENLAQMTQHLPDILSVYRKVLNLKKNSKAETNLSVDIRIGNVIPIDWIYSPIIVLYTQHQQHKNNSKIDEEEQQIYVITNCLRWLYIYETYFPHLATTIRPTDRFCRLACIFLCSDTLFLNEEIQRLLTLTFKQLVKYEMDINFDNDVEGLNNFQDFYVQLLEQYQGVSYGNHLFGNFILIPLTQRQNVKWKKILYSEYAGVVQIFNVNKEQIFVDYNLFIEPREKDLSLIKCYKRIIQSSSIRRHSVLYDIISYHLKAS